MLFSQLLKILFSCAQSLRNSQWNASCEHVYVHSAVKSSEEHQVRADFAQTSRVLAILSALSSDIARSKRSEGTTAPY